MKRTRLDRALAVIGLAASIATLGLVAAIAITYPQTRPSRAVAPDYSPAWAGTLAGVRAAMTDDRREARR